MHSRVREHARHPVEGIALLVPRGGDSAIARAAPRREVAANRVEVLRVLGLLLAAFAAALRRELCPDHGASRIFSTKASISSGAARWRPKFAARLESTTLSRR